MFPYVKKGDPFKPNASFDNECRKIVNQFAGHGVPAVHKKTIEQTKVQCYNAGSMLLTAGSSVCFDDQNKASLDTIVPVKICDSDSKLFGVLDHDLASGDCGTVTVSGVARIKYSSDLQYVIPDFNGGFMPSASGNPVIWRFDNGDALILLENTPERASYNGPFAFTVQDNGDLKISSGFLNRNGKMLKIPETIFTERQEGYICVVSRFDDEQNIWRDPIITIADVAADSCPIGYCKVINQEDGYPVCEFECYNVPVAFILYTKECPLAAKYNG